MAPWTVARQAPLSIGFPRQEYWSGLPFPPPGDLSSPGIEPESPVSPTWQVDSLPLYRLVSPDTLDVCVHVKLLSCVRLFATPWTVAHQAPPSMGFSRQEYWSGLPFSSPDTLDS